MWLCEVPSDSSHGIFSKYSRASPWRPWYANNTATLFSRRKSFLCLSSPCRAIRSALPKSGATVRATQEPKIVGRFEKGSSYNQSSAAVKLSSQRLCMILVHAPASYERGASRAFDSIAQLPILLDIHAACATEFSVGFSSALRKSCFVNRVFQLRAQGYRVHWPILKCGQDESSWIQRTVDPF